jgi:hypothetical protein
MFSAGCCSAMQRTPKVKNFNFLRESSFSMGEVRRYKGS